MAIKRGSIAADPVKPTLEAVCFADFGDTEIVFLALPGLPDSVLGRRRRAIGLKERRVSWAMAAFEQYFLAKMRFATTVPWFERLGLRGVGRHCWHRLCPRKLSKPNFITGDEMMVMDKITPPSAQPTYHFRHVRTIALVAGLMLVSGGTGWWFNQAANREQPVLAPASATNATPIQLQTTTARVQPIAANRVLIGTVEPMESVTLTSRVMGQIRQLRVQEGDRVSAGATLAVIDVADIQAQGGQALAGVNMAQSNYQTAQARLQEAQAQLLETEAELADAQLEQRRMQALQSDGAVSQQLLDKANTRVRMTRARIQQIKAGIAQSRSSLNQAQAQVNQAQAQVNQVSANLNYGTIAAPFDGVITRKHTEVGAMAGAGQPLLTLESSDRLRFSTQVPESLITQIRQGQKVSVHLDALNQDLPGTVSQIIPSADPTTRNFTVKVALDQTAKVIPGMFGRLKLASQPAQKTSDRTILMVPQSVIVQQFGITGVYKMETGQASFQPVTTGKIHGTDIEIFSGISEGDRLVINPSPDLKNNPPVQPT